MTEWQSASHIRVVGRWGVLRLTGELDIESVPEVERLLVRLLALEKPVVVMDLREVTFFDCAILGVMCRARTGVLAAGGRFAVLCTRPWALKVMRLADLLEVFAPVASLTDLADLDALDGGPDRGSRA
ncbi:STAS domain-containing protein [Streptomyces sp. NPDC020799]|uniref:STAS domain-containing protein n=1 Tax=Streptomyces sp. NPDC020799 TaxID=3365091 RepID=UPI0037A9E6C8